MNDSEGNSLGEPRPCPHCGYDLRMIESRRCPECGRLTPLAGRPANADERMMLVLQGYKVRQLDRPRAVDRVADHRDQGPSEQEEYRRAAAALRELMEARKARRRHSGRVLLILLVLGLLPALAYALLFPLEGIVHAGLLLGLLLLGLLPGISYRFLYSPNPASDHVDELKPTSATITSPPR